MCRSSAGSAFAALVCVLLCFNGAAGLPGGVRLDDVFVATEDIQSGSKAFPTGSYLVSVSVAKKAALLQEMTTALTWTPTFTFSDAMPIFAGILNKAEVLWLLSRSEVLGIEADGKVSIANGPPAGVKIGGALLTAQELQSGSKTIPTANYMVGVVAGSKQTVLDALDVAWSWSPRSAYSISMPLFAGVLNVTQVVWLLQREDVTYIEEDVQVTHAGFAVGVKIDGSLVTLADLLGGSASVPTGSYIVGVPLEQKAALLEQMHTLFGWNATMPYSDRMPMFAGVLDQSKVVWLLQQEAGTRYIEQDAVVGVATGAGGVKLDGGFFSATDINSGSAQIPTGSYLVGVSTDGKAALLEEMKTNFDGWMPTSSYSSSMPAFAGELDHAKVVWLLQQSAVTSIEQDVAVSHASGPPAGVSLDGVLITAAEIQSGSKQVPTGGFLVGVNTQIKAFLLEEMRVMFNWIPTFSYSSQMPMFAGVLNQEQLLWLLAHSDVTYVENDATIGIAAPPPGVIFNGKLVTKAKIESGSMTIPRGEYVVSTRNGFKAAILEEMRAEFAWSPTMPLPMMSIFIGELDQAQVLWLLGKTEVEYIRTDLKTSENENDGNVFVGAAGKNAVCSHLLSLSLAMLLGLVF